MFFLITLDIPLVCKISLPDFNEINMVPSYGHLSSIGCKSF
jgi:hypothetical protein